MHAAVVTTFGQSPAFAEFPDPIASKGEIVVEVLASAIHPRVRSQADGSHYTSTDELPLVPGIDGVGRTAEGELRYFVLPDTTLGAMAERTLIDPRRSIRLPDDVDPVLIAAAMNPAMSSWNALRRRIDFAPDSRVLIMGATAAQVVWPTHHRRGRDAAKLAALLPLGADVVIDLSVAPDEQLTWVQIGSIAGRDAAIPSAALRATRLQIVGSGQGSVSTRDILAELPELALELSRGDYKIGARVVPLSDITAAWAEAAVTDDRLVVVPRATRD
ncbi:quinone oxidoreductase [Auriculariales sp. MPI-PUGE-AT-0066]|nr:quinone oxidoreductase [Auriculariales sp. MPI-PUGE-AT-0066]